MSAVCEVIRVRVASTLNSTHNTLASGKYVVIPDDTGNVGAFNDVQQCY